MHARPGTLNMTRMHTQFIAIFALMSGILGSALLDRKSTRLNSSH